MKAKLFWLIVLVALVGFGYLQLSDELPAPGDASRDPAAPTPTVSRSMPADDSPGVEAPVADGIRRVVQDVAIKNYGKVIYRGPVDLTKTIERIRAGVRHSHRNDGSVFGNRERLLPKQSRGYYREYVHPTEGMGGPGPQRVVVGRDGDWWYTPDHYASFIELGSEVR